MKNTNDTSKLGRAPQVRELRDDELQEVSGGRDVRKGGAIIVYDYEGSALRGGTKQAAGIHRRSGQCRNLDRADGPPLHRGNANSVRALSITVTAITKCLIWVPLVN